MTLLDRMTRWFHRLAFWRRPLTTQPAQIVPEVVPVAELAEPTEKPKRRNQRAKSDTAFVHMTDVLDLLPKCRELIAPIKKFDSDGYRFWRQFGAKIVPETLSIGGDLPELLDMPHVGMVFYYVKNKKNEDFFPGNFWYFQRLKSDRYNFAVPPNAAAIYEVCVAFTDHKDHPFGYEYAVAVGSNGSLSVISQRQVTAQHLPRGGSFYRIEWGLPKGLIFHLKETNRLRPGLYKNANDFGVWMFASAIQSVVKTSDDFQVRAERNGTSVAFNVALGRTPQFFKDRETEVTTDGKRKRIFHAVKEHARVGADGKTSTVKAHYRGERSFMWKGENITITPAERSLTKTFNLLAHRFSDDQTPSDKMISQGSIAGKIRSVVESEWRKIRA